MAYDSNGNRVASEDRGGRTTTYAYDALNRITQTTFPDQTINQTVYDDLGRVRFRTDARSVTNASGYDVTGRQIASTNALGTSVQMVSAFTFDANGNQITATDAAELITTNVFDILNRKVQVKYADGTKTQTGYDSASRRVAETNQDSVVTRFAYDGAGRLLAVTNVAGTIQQIVTQYTYDEAGNQTKQIDALNRTTLFYYDSMGRRIQRVLPQLQSETMGYDLAGNLIRSANFNSVVITNQYDVMNRLTNRTSLNHYQVGFAYDAVGNRTSLSDPSGATSYSYDNRERLLLKTVAWTGGPVIALNYSYDSNGNMAGIWSSSPGGVNLQYAYDALNRITNVLANGNGAANYGFDLDGNLQTLRYGNGLTNLYQYDTLNRLTNLVWKSNLTTVASFYYQLGATGNRTNLAETILTAVTNRTYAWTYDLIYRLTNENISAVGALGYWFDAVGNRTNRSSTVSQLPSIANNYSPNDWLTNDAYDNNGNTLWDTNASAFGQYYYDVENRLTNFNNAVYLGYNGDGIRVKKTVGSTTTFYLVDDRNPSGYAQVLEEWTGTSGSTSLSRVYNYGLSLIRQDSGSATCYLISDGHGSTRLLTDSGGSVANAFTYDAYGTLIGSNTAPQTLYLYCGEQFDSNLGTYYLRARYFNPNTGRFWTVDTDEGEHEEPLSLHKYLYAADNPVDNTDPSGNEVEGLLTVMNISTTMFAQVAPATTKVGSIFDVAWGASRALTSAEIDLARTIYKGNIDYTKTGVDYGKWKFFQTKGREMTPDGIIHTGGETISDYTVPGAKPGWPAASLLFQKGILIHELCHVWQYQQSGSLVLRGLYRKYEYAGPNFGKLAFSDYGIEQQAQMTEDYFYLRNGDSSSPTIPRPTPALPTYEKILPFLK